MYLHSICPFSFNPWHQQGKLTWYFLFSGTTLCKSSSCDVAGIPADLQFDILRPVRLAPTTRSQARARSLCHREALLHWQNTRHKAQNNTVGRWPDEKHNLSWLHVLTAGAIYSHYTFEDTSNCRRRLDSEQWACYVVWLRSRWSCSS